MLKLAVELHWLVPPRTAKNGSQLNLVRRELASPRDLNCRVHQWAGAGRLTEADFLCLPR